MSQVSVEVFTWLDFDKDVSTLREKILATGYRFENIYGIPRGGLVLAVALSHVLNLPLKTREEEVGVNTLIVDDISDSGDTLLPYRRSVTATLHVVRGTKVVPTFYTRVRQKNWVIYPWEYYD